MENQQTQRIRLRGHHIGDFAEYLYQEKETQRYSDDPVRQQASEQLIKKVRMQDRSLKNRLYGEEMEEKVYGIYELLRNHPETEIEIVNGLDSICTCAGKCPNKKKNCEVSPAKSEDHINLELYALEVGRVYTAAEIQRRIEIFTEATKFTSPRSIGFLRKIFGDKFKISYRLC